MFDFRNLISLFFTATFGILMSVQGCLSAVVPPAAMVAGVAVLSTQASGCSIEKDRLDNGLAAADKLSAMAEKHGLKVKTKFVSDGAGLDHDQSWRLTLGELQVEAENNELAPVLLRMLEQNHAIMLAMVQRFPVHPGAMP